ncbi:MAG: O-antigen ligase family protein [Immundisolibacteraceae bacterium]|nr:O-antigen ligase family protein [Immundisolibacteraceae bacterium]
MINGMHGLWLVLPIALFALLLVLAQDLGFTWMVLLGFCAAVLAGLIWFGKLIPGLLFIFMASVPIVISKHIYSPPGTFTLPISIYLCDVVFFAFALLWLWRLIFIERRAPLMSVHYKWVLILVAWIAISVIWSEHPSYVFTSVFNYVRITLIMIVLVDVLQDKGLLKYVFAGVLLALAANACMSILQLLTTANFQLQGVKVGLDATRLQYGGGAIEVYRPSGLTVHPNMLASLMVFITPVIASYLLMYRNRWRGWLWRLVFLLYLAGMTALGITLSRGGWLSVAISMLFVLIVFVQAGMLPKRVLVNLGIGAMLAVTIAIVVYPALLLRVTQPDHRSGESRLLLIEQALMIIKSDPVLGIGAGNYSSGAQTATPASFAALPDEYVTRLKEGVVHNKYLLVLSELGVVGLLLFLFMLVHFVRMPFSRRVWHDPWLFSLSVGLSATIVGHMLFFMVDHFYSEISMQQLWLVFALLVVVERLDAAVAGPKKMAT